MGSRSDTDEKGGVLRLDQSRCPPASHPSEPLLGPSALPRMPFGCRKRDPFQGLRMSSCLTLGNELSNETHMLTKQDTLWGRNPPPREQQDKRTQENCLRFYGDGVSFQVFSGQLSCSAHIWSGPGSFLAVHAPLSQDGFQRQGCWDVGHLPLPIGPSQILLVSLQGSTKVLIRASCCETT